MKRKEEEEATRRAQEAAVRRQQQEAKKREQEDALSRKATQLREKQEARQRQNEEKRERARRVQQELLEKQREKRVAQQQAKAARALLQSWYCDVAGDGCERPTEGHHEPSFCCYRLDDYVVCEHCYEHYLTADQQHELERIALEAPEDVC